MATADKILNNEDLEKKLIEWRKNGLKIVFTNGCFDILHLGHVDYLEKAKSFGDKLIVGLNTDTSVQRLKGPQRPINNEYSRGRVMAALEFVDGIVFFGEDTPYELIKKVLPDILVKGNDYSISNIIGADIVMGHGGNVLTVDLVEGFSTTKIAEKIKNK